MRCAISCIQKPKSSKEGLCDMCGVQSCFKGGPVNWPQRTVRLACSIHSLPTEHSTLTQPLNVALNQIWVLTSRRFGHQDDLICNSALIPLLHAHHWLRDSWAIHAMAPLPTFSPMPLSTALQLSTFSSTFIFPECPAPCGLPALGCPLAHWVPDTSVGLYTHLMGAPQCVPTV